MSFNILLGMFYILFHIFIFLFPSQLFALDTPGQTKPLKIGFIGCLSEFAASYGQAVLDGVLLAKKELESANNEIDLIVEDDRSTSKETVNAYKKLVEFNSVNAIISGSWWANAIAKLSERDTIPVLSCETYYEKDFVNARTYFVLPGDLREWIRSFVPLVENKGYKTGAIVRFSSGFGTTLAEEMKIVFGAPGRNFVGEIEYSDGSLSDAATIAVRLKQLNPEVVYIDAHPGGLGLMLRKMRELGLNRTVVFASSAAEDMIKQKLIDSKTINNEIYFTKRETYSSDFVERFKRHYGREPILQADLGYYALHLIYKAYTQAHGNMTMATDLLRNSTLQASSQSFKFDSNNVWHGLKMGIWKISNEGVVTASSH